MSEAEEKKLEAADRKDRKDAERDMGEDPIETTEGKPRKDAKRRDGQDEEIPAWADAIMKRLDAMDRRDRKDADERRPLEAADRKDRKDGDEKEHNAGERAEGAEEEKRKLEDRKGRKDESEAERERDWKEGGHKANEDRWAKERDDRHRKDEGDHDEDTDREDRARRDSQLLSENRKMSAKIAEMESRISAVYREPSIADREAIAEARSRADVLYQAIENRPASIAIPGESPISYRKRLVDGLRKYSDRMKDVRVDALTGAAFEVVEDTIYADAQAAIRSDAIIPANTLRPITTNDRGHYRTDYVGDSSVWTEPFSAGAVRRLKLINPKAAH